MKQESTYLRFDIYRRIEHSLLILSFGILGLTGLVQKFSTANISDAIIAVLGGIEVTRIIHRTAAMISALEILYHLIVMGYRLLVMQSKAAMVPDFKDVRDGFQSFLYNLGIQKERPRMGKYNFVEKLEYWAMVWGYVIMGLTGFMMWNPIATTQLLPGQIIPAAKAAHGAEAILAVASIILWHFYNVHLRDFNWSMITGKLTRHQMEEEHPLQLEAIEKEKIEQQPSHEVIIKRQRLYFPIAGVITLLGIFGVIAFTTFENTAITTVPPVEPSIVVYVPQTPTPAPTPLPSPTVNLTPVTSTDITWDGVIGPMFQQTCKMCHSQVETYTGFLQGDQNGPWIIPGNSEGSRIIQVQSQGGHPGQFSDQELNQVKSWIDAGAPEK